MPQLSIVCYNVDGLLNKLNDTDFLKFIDSQDVICFCETFITTLDELPKNIFSSFYKYFAPAVQLRNGGRASGGVLVLCKSSLNVTFSQIHVSYDNCVVLKLKHAFTNVQKDLMIICTYIPPYNSPYYTYKSPYEKNGINLFENVLHNLMDEHENTSFIITGDFNSRLSSCQPMLENNIDKYIDFDMATSSYNSVEDTDFQRNSMDTFTNSFGESLIKLCTIFELFIVNGMKSSPLSGFFTNISVHGKSVVDYFLLSNDLINKHFNMSILDRTESTHMAIKLVICLNDVIINNAEPNNVNKYVTKFIWNNDKSPTFIDNIASVTHADLLSECVDLIDTNVDTSLLQFNDSILNAASCMKKQFKCHSNSYNNKCNWFDNDCIRQKKEVRTYLNRYKRTKDDQTKEQYIAVRRKYKHFLKQKRKQFCKCKAKRLVSNCKNNSVSFWSDIKNISAERQAKSNIDINTWYNYFKDVFHSVKGVPPICLEMLQPTTFLNDNYNHLITNELISPEEILHSFKKIKPKKAVGSDLISNEMLICSQDIIVPYLTTLFQYLFNNGIYPDCWSTSTIIPILKKGDSGLCTNYRPISLTSLVSKLYTGIINNRIKLYLDYNNIICKEQGGYREGHSPIEHIFTLYGCVNKQFSKNRKLYAAFVDYKCCFDSVSREGLFHILTKIGINGKLFNAIKSIYNNVLACVRSNDEMSELFSCPTGLKQGCLCSPSLFLIFINELSIALNINGKHGIQLISGSESLFHLLFADDSLLLSDTITGLQNQLNILNNQSTRLGLDVNLSKTKIVVFRKGGFLSRYEKWTYNNEPLQVVNSYKYLGVDFTTRLSFNNLTSSFVSKAKQACYGILSSLKKIDCYDLDVFTKLFDTKVKPILLYASELWGCCDFVEIEKVHLFALKRFLNISLHASNTLVYGESGRYPLHVCSKLRALKFWFKITKYPNERIVNMTYRMLSNLDSDGYTNWVSNVRNMLCENGYAYVWLFQSVGCEKTFLFNFKQTLIDSYKQGWHDKLVNGEHFEFYSSFKTIIDKEKYLCQHFMTKGFRDSLIKFRLAVSQINCHRYKFDVNKDKLYCPLCINTKETEKHILFDCPYYEQLRVSCLPDELLRERDIASVTGLMKQDCYNHSLGRFLFYLFKRREALINQLRE